MMNIFKYFCHQIPERSFHYKNKQFPVCSRCTGVIIGATIYLIMFLIFNIPYTFQYLLISFIIMVPLIIDGGTQYLQLRVSNNLLRFFTGLFFGIGLSFISSHTMQIVTAFYNIFLYFLLT